LPNDSSPERSERYSVVGRNTANAHAESIHDDERANIYGFKGGLVPGVNVVSHMCHPLLERWGKDWLKEGSLDVLLRRPAYHDEKIDVTGRFHLGSEPENCEVEAVSEDQICASGIGVRRSGIDVNSSRLPDFKEAKMPAPENRPFLNGSQLLVGMPLGSIKGVYSRQEGCDFMEQMGEHHYPFTQGEYAHPGVLLSYAIYSFVWSLTTQVGIHAGCQVSFHNLLRAGMTYETRGQISKNYLVGSTNFVEYDHIILSGDDIILSGRQKVVVAMEKR